MTGSGKDVGWERGRGQPRTGEQDHSFIVRVRVSTASDGGERRPQFSVEDVAGGLVERFATFDAAARSLERSVRRIVSGLPSEKPRP